MNKANGRQRLLDATRALMLKKGFNATSIDEICTKAHITKGALFYHFKDKEALGKAAVEYHLQLGQAMLANAPFLKKRDPMSRLIAYIDCIIQATNNPINEGCLLGTFSQELGAQNNSIVDACNKGFTHWQIAVAQMLEAARLKYKPNSKLNCESLAQQFLATYEGAIVLAKATHDCSTIINTMNHYKNYLKLIFNHGK